MHHTHEMAIEYITQAINFIYVFSFFIYKVAINSPLVFTRICFISFLICLVLYQTAIWVCCFHGSAFCTCSITHFKCKKTIPIHTHLISFEKKTIFYTNHQEKSIEFVGNGV